jgi:hypothetical protein
VTDDLKVVVLGCGPAGLMAAHAAAMAGCDIRIISKARKSHMRGAQYLHAPIPVASRAAPFRISYTLLGTPFQYRRKVYGDSWDGTVSPEDLAEDHDAWDIREAYNWLWDTYGDYVQDFDLSSEGLMRAMRSEQVKTADFVISTVPATLLCRNNHTFSYSEIWSTDNPIVALADDHVVCNGTGSAAWYRAARIQGWDTVEWSSSISRPPVTPLWQVTKPLKTNCTCLPRIHRMGRYGKWEKGVLSHSAFYETAELITKARAQGTLSLEWGVTT